MAGRGWGGGINGEALIKGYKLISSGDLMYSTGIIVNNTILCI